MATSQLAYQLSTGTAQHFIAKVQPTNYPPIELEHVSVSELLGRDYLFIDAKKVSLPLKNPSALHATLDDLIEKLSLAEAHTVAVSFEEAATGALSFVRYDLTWHQHKICHVESICITQAEQHEFMEMIWRCSTAAAVC